LKKGRYKFTVRNQSRRGIISVLLGTLSVLMTAGMVAVAYMRSGQAERFVAIPGFAAMLLSAAGLYYSIRGTMEEDVYHLLPWIGFLINGMVLAAYVLIYILGW